ncbi:porphobilinogen deaminase, dipyromethane cofactor binding domain-containing protein [Lipomyces japonicus]|uniref:porphobilinogen deaminase, dipyromethane cofactor binding domain-containing protein n=1 Tax=Lipomyces japonicus TaxID=56871 RepID=UPI0034CF495F
MSKVIRLGSRTSPLAVAQTEIIAAKLKAHFPEYTYEIVTKATLGDEVQNKALYAFGGKALWTSELEALLVDDAGVNKIDLIVHSLKDLPTNLPNQFELGGIFDREDPRDALVVRSDLPYKTLEELPEGSVVGTSSVRRTAQLRRRYPKLEFKVVRGNMSTRLSKLEDKEQGYTCIIVAIMGLKRIGLDHHITQFLSAPDLLYAVGQGALGVEIRKGDEFIKSLLQPAVDRKGTIECVAERSLMRKLEGGCSVPLGVQSTFTGTELKIEACVVSPDGSQIASADLVAPVSTIEQAEQFGKDIAALLLENGAGPILEQINYDRIN